ncbi:Protein-disulfide isomerase [Saccharicrinis carchari]|uniref:Protein-disulfide isomerase n=2 Tax=Saccharicrinis carchari TaxID=1168039 RepID=A0A521D0F8_SACCC|nr:Protein-disulfide isomerase [Saccharicrinis carchari]
MLKRNYIYTVCFCLAMLVFGGCKNAQEQGVRRIEAILQQNAEDIVFGNETAKHTIFLYASYNCQYCRYLFSRTFPGLKENYLDKGLVKVVLKFVDFGEDPQTQYALKAASCIYRHGNYHKFHELLLADPAIVASEKFRALVDDIMAENTDIAQCVLSKPDSDFLKNNLKEFREHQFTGTPTMVINKHVYTGFVSFEKIDAIIKKEFEM